MDLLSPTELYLIQGGAIKFTAALINASSRVISVLLDLGRSLGTSIRMVTSGKRC